MLSSKMTIKLYILFFIGLYIIARTDLVSGNPTELEFNYYTDDRFTVNSTYLETDITTIFPSSTFLCLKECARRSPCDQMVFKKSTLECFLLRRVDSSYLAMSGGDKITSSPQVWNNTAEWFGECANVNCTGTTICIISPQSGPQCIGYKCIDEPEQTNLIKDPPHGNLVGARALYTCPGTYETYQNVFSYCSPTGQWSPPTTCDHCGDPPIVNNSILQVPITNQQDDVIWYTCPGSYETHQNITSTCQENTEWSIPTHCKHCGDPPFVNNSILVKPISHLEGEVIRYECSGSYLEDQNITSICQSNTTWTQPTSCKYCGDPPEIVGGVIAEPIFHLEGETIEYTCPDAYNTTQNIRSTCQTDTTWTPVQNCQHCGEPPEVRNGILIQPVYNIENETVSYSCTKSYLADQNITSTCQENGTWTIPQACKHCGVPPEIVGGVITEPIFHLEGETIEYTCPDAYNTTQNIRSTCQTDTTWTPVQNCQHCGEPPEVRNGTLIQPVYNIENETVSYSCIHSYLVDQNITSMCQENGTWTTPQACKHCGPHPSPEGGELMNTVLHEEGEVIIFTCTNSYDPTQTINSTCLEDGQWSSIEDCKHCGDPPFVNNSILVEPISHLEGEVIRYECPGSYFEDQNITSTCQSNSTWTQPTFCKYCGPPPSPEGGELMNTVLHEEGEVIIFTCTNSYDPTQTINSTCLEDGQWSSTDDCKHCGDPPFVNNTILVEPITHLEGEVIRYQCSELSLGDQNMTSTCQSNTTWTQPTTSCNNYCEDPQPVNLISQPSNYYIVGDEVDYNCTYQEIPYVAKSVCQQDGHWSQPKCSIDLNNCQDLKNCNAELTDGEYWLFPHNMMNAATKVYCHNLGGTPQEFISLPPGNIVGVANLHQSYPACEMNGTGPAYNVTEFFKLRVDFSKLNVHRNDFTFTNMSEPNLQHSFGDGRGCTFATAEVENNCPPLGYFKINMTGTGVTLSSSEGDWEAMGDRASCSVTTGNSSGTEFIGKVDGNCGDCIARFMKIIDVEGSLPVSEATVPYCSSD